MAYNHKYVIGSQYQFYNNSEILDTNVNFASWRCDLVHSDSLVAAVTSVCTLTKDIISGVSYRWYSNLFTFPSVGVGCFRFLVTDTVSGLVMYMSDEIDTATSDEDLLYVKFRNAINIFNFNYVGVPTFYNYYHIEMLKRKPINPEVTQGYDVSTGAFQRVRTIFTKSFEFVTGWFDDSEHEATQTMCIHSDIQIFYNGVWNAMAKPQDSEYLIEWMENYENIEASFRLEQTNKSTSNLAL